MQAAFVLNIHLIVSAGIICSFPRSILPADNPQHICTIGHILYRVADSGPFYHNPDNNDMAHLSRIQFHIRNVDTLHQKCLQVSNIADPDRGI
jgi:hypothetical protein